MTLDILLSITLIICLVTDLKDRRIYNKVLLPALVIGVALNIYSVGWAGLISSAQGFFLGLAFLLLPFIMGGIGAGDVKLLATVGAIKGPQFVFYSFIGMGIAGGVLAILILIYQKRLFKTIKAMLQDFRVMMATDFKVICFGTDSKENAFPYGVAIAFGVVAAYVMG